ncbi:hypothetical protein Glove_202g105 [Diversispora epigaea]|uniref:Uncharacterized protein n=1 Tax=Diversispora epigaea TaxID=1348612 RepID=A0A397ISY0_9GLOM|nr:hypothetical protein Glove_202g105 [Diversispora epigaea]
MHLAWNLRFFLDSDFFANSSIIGLIFAFLVSSLRIVALIRSKRIGYCNLKISYLGLKLGFLNLKLCMLSLKLGLHD